MRSLLATIALLACLVAPLRAEPAAADQAAIQDVITRQLDAFRRDDAAAAFALAAPSIQSMFGSAANFLSMVQTGYKPVHRPRSVDFGPLTDEGGEIVQRVELTGPDGLPYTARYTMEREADGSWRISGCQLIESKRLGV